MSDAGKGDRDRTDSKKFKENFSCITWDKVYSAGRSVKIKNKKEIIKYGNNR
jgi:hypothetical protein